MCSPRVTDENSDELYVPSWFWNNSIYSLNGNFNIARNFDKDLLLLFWLLIVFINSSKSISYTCQNNSFFVIIKPVTIIIPWKKLKLNSGTFLAFGFPCYEKKWMK